MIAQYRVAQDHKDDPGSVKERVTAPKKMPKISRNAIWKNVEVSL